MFCKLLMDHQLLTNNIDRVEPTIQLTIEDDKAINHGGHHKFFKLRIPRKLLNRSLRKQKHAQIQVLTSCQDFSWIDSYLHTK